MKTLAAVLLLIAAALAPASAGEYSLINRHPIVFPGSHRHSSHLSPFPTSQRSADIWAADSCWRGCSSKGAWRLHACLKVAGADACRAQLDSDGLACLRQCRLSGGPLLNITN